MSSLDAVKALLTEDDALGAQSLLSMSSDMSPEAMALRRLVTERLEHIQSHAAYAAFYTPRTREYMPESAVPHCHMTLPRWGLIRDQLHARRAQSVLELGTFDGFCLLNYAMSWPKGSTLSLEGIDLCTEAVAEASRRAGMWGLPCRFHTGLIEEVALEQRFDAVLLLEVLEHVIDIEPVLQAAERHLHPGGAVYVSTPLSVARLAQDAMSVTTHRKEHVRAIGAEQFLGMLQRRGRQLLYYQQLPTEDGATQLGGYTL